VILDERDPFSSVVVHTRSRNAHTHKTHITKMKNKIIIPSSWLASLLFLFSLFCFSPVLGDEYDHKVK
jgi:hypothetical protein